MTEYEYKTEEERNVVDAICTETRGTIAGASCSLPSIMVREITGVVKKLADGIKKKSDQKTNKGRL